MRQDEEEAFVLTPYICKQHGECTTRDEMAGGFCRDCEDERLDALIDFECDGSWWGEDPPLYPDGKLAGMDEAALHKEARRQCNIHDNGVDNFEMNHPVIEDAAARLRMVEAELKRRGFSDRWLDDDDAPSSNDGMAEFDRTFRPGWDKDCPKCVGSKFTCDEHSSSNDEKEGGR